MSGSAVARTSRLRETRAMTRKQTSTRRTPVKRAEPTRLMIVDDHPIWRDTLRQLLEHAGVGRVVAEASDGDEAIERAAEAAPDLVIMDINLPGTDGIEATRALVAERRDLKVLALSSSGRRAHVLEAVRAGAIGYMIKTASPDDVVEAVRRVQRGEMVFPPSLSDVVLGEVRRAVEGGPIPSPPRVVVADGAAIDREGLAGVLLGSGFEVVAQAGDAGELLERTEALTPDVVVVDAGLAAQPDAGRSLVQQIRALSPRTGVVVLAREAESMRTLEIVSGEGGGVGYLLKDRMAGPDELGEAIRRVARGESVIPPDIVSNLVERPHRDGTLEVLTERETEVLALMAEGRSNQAIGERLFLGRKTIEAHVHNIFTKLGLEEAADDHRRVLAVLAYLHSLS